MDKAARIRKAFADGEGVIRMAPNFVPRSFNQPGRRLKLHPDDYFALGMDRGAITERWFSSVCPAANGPLAPADEGMSYVSLSEDKEDKILFKDFIDELKDQIIGKKLYDEYGTFPMYAKFYDNNGPLFHHIHPEEEAVKAVGNHQKPEAYYFSPQMNNHMGTAPYTYFGFDPEITKEDVKERLLMFRTQDNKITELSRAYRVQLGTGWYTPPGVVHAPASVCTYEPQWNADCNVVMENVTAGEVNKYESLSQQCPEDKKEDIDYIMGFLNWEKNVDPDYRKHYFRPPITIHEDEQYIDKWVAYANPYVAAKELTILPGQSVLVKDDACYGCILVQGHGKFGKFDCESPTMIHFGDLTADEFFVSEDAAKKGVLIENTSKFDPLVILKHFGPNNTAPQEVPSK